MWKGFAKVTISTMKRDNREIPPPRVSFFFFLLWKVLTSGVGGQCQFEVAGVGGQSQFKVSGVGGQCQFESWDFGGLTVFSGVVKLKARNALHYAHCRASLSSPPAFFLKISAVVKIGGLSCYPLNISFRIMLYLPISALSGEKNRAFSITPTEKTESPPKSQLSN